MITKRGMAVALLATVLMGTTSARAWSGEATQPAASAGGPTSANVSGESLLQLIAPILTDPVAREKPANCKGGELYSSHDVVGDPEACFMGRMNVGGTSGVPAAY
jgi:hypothetical protein